MDILKKESIRKLNRKQRLVPCMVLPALITAAIFTVTAQAPSAAPADQRKDSITHYFWFSNINGTLKYNYRNLYYDQSGDKLIQDMRFDGFALGVTFRF